MLNRFVFVIVVLAAAAARAQEPAPADPNVLLSTALQRLKTSENVSAAVEVKHEPPEAEEAAQGGFGGMILTTEVMGEAMPFEGRLEACRTPDGTSILLSEKELPGFALWVTEDRTIERTTFEEDRFSLDQLRGELTALLDPTEFARRILEAKLEATRDEATGAVTYRGKVDRDIVPATGGELSILQGRVLDVHATLVVEQDGGLQSAAIKVTRSDPMREMMRGGEIRKIMIAGGAPGGALPPADDDKKHDIPGGSTIYTLTYGNTGPSARANAFKAEVERLLRAPEHGDPLPPDQGK